MYVSNVTLLDIHPPDSASSHCKSQPLNAHWWISLQPIFNVGLDFHLSRLLIRFDCGFLQVPVGPCRRPRSTGILFGLDSLFAKWTISIANTEMLSTLRFFGGNMICGVLRLKNRRMPECTLWAFFLISINLKWPPYTRMSCNFWSNRHRKMCNTSLWANFNARNRFPSSEL